MKSLSNAESNIEAECFRCRPLLGTFVEVRLRAGNLEESNGALHAAYEVMEDVHRRMSVHDPESELSRINATAFLKPVPVSSVTFEVLKRARTLSEKSEGAFDVTVAPQLAKCGLLPKFLCRETSSACFQDVELLPNQHVRFRKPTALDLGGIAKGYAVDLAIEAMRRQGAFCGVVNAGGDLRVFGSVPSVIHLRHPTHGGVVGPRVCLENRAMATSSPVFSRRRWRRRWVSALWNPQFPNRCAPSISVSVSAPECWMADALTKVVFNRGEQAAPLLKEYGAEAFILAT